MYAKHSPPRRKGYVIQPKRMHPRHIVALDVPAAPAGVVTGRFTSNKPNFEEVEPAPRQYDPEAQRNRSLADPQAVTGENGAAFFRGKQYATIAAAKAARTRASKAGQ